MAELTPERRNALQGLAARLAVLGLGDLLSIGPKGEVTGWLVDQFVAGIDTWEELEPALEQLPSVRQQYGIVFELRERAGKGEPVQPLSIAQVREYRVNASQMMRAAGFPPTLYDTAGELDDLIRKGHTLEDLQSRVVESWNRVAQGDPAVRDYFAQHFGGVGQGDQWLAAVFLDEEASEKALDKASRTAAVGGTGTRYGYQVSRTQAEELANLGFDEANSGNRFAQADALRPLTTETASERTDLTDDDALAASFQAAGGTDATRALRRRSSDRQAAFSGGGGAAASQRGVVGLGEGR